MKRARANSWDRVLFLGITVMVIAGSAIARGMLLWEGAPHLLAAIQLPSALWSIVLIIVTGTLVHFARLLCWYERAVFLFVTESLLFLINYLLATDLARRLPGNLNIPLFSLSLQGDQICIALLSSLLLLQIAEAVMIERLMVWRQRLGTVSSGKGSGSRARRVRKDSAIKVSQEKVCVRPSPALLANRKSG